MVLAVYLCNREYSPFTPVPVPFIHSLGRAPDDVELFYEVLLSSKDNGTLNLNKTTGSISQSTGLSNFELINDI